MSVLLRETKVARQAGPRAHPTHLRPPMLCGDQAVTHSLWLRIMANRDTVREPPLQYITPTTSVQKPILSMTSSSWSTAQPSSSHTEQKKDTNIHCEQMRLPYLPGVPNLTTVSYDPIYLFLCIVCRLDGKVLYTASQQFIYQEKYKIGVHQQIVKNDL